MIQDKLSLIPHVPGCYLMKNKDGFIIYVGKSKNLRNRVTSYFIGMKMGKTKRLVSEIADFEYIITNTETESLLLEINLIKKYRPKYNILLMDDKSYPYIELTKDKVPRLVVVRNVNLKRNKKDNLYGPYPNVTAARKTVDLINRLYPLRKCKNYEKKTCLYYHIKECLGYCQHEVSDNLILKMKNEIISFLNGNDDIIVNKLKDKMLAYSNNLDFEKALEYRTLLEDITKTLEKQKMELADNLNRDIIGYYTKNGYMAINLLFIRGGRLLDQTNQIYPIVGTEREMLNSYISLFYDRNKILPKEVIVPALVMVSSLIDTFNIKFIIPKKGVKKNLLDLSFKNAKNYYDEQITLITRNTDKINESLQMLKELLKLDKLDRIELFDNSHLFGTYNVSGMVVFESGEFRKNEYRKYKIISEQSDDYHTMREVIYRRYFKVLKEKLVYPDLIIVDGGIGQINVAKEVLNELNMKINVCGLKKDSHHNTNVLMYNNEEIMIDKTSNLFHLLTRMQDEIHNYTISYHKNIRSKGALVSILDMIKGLGEVRKKELITKYKNLDNMKGSSLEELKEILPEKVALSLYDYLHREEENTSF